MALAHSFSDGFVICYVLLVLWMMSCFHIIAVWNVTCIPKCRQKMINITAEIPTKFCSVIKINSTHCELHTRAKPAIYNFLVMYM